MATLHTIKASLYDNALTENPNDFIARVSSERSLSVKDIAGSAATRGGADVSAAAMEHAVNLWLKEMAYRLCDGFSVNAGWFNASVGIRGVFDSPNEGFNPAKHTVSFDFQQGAQLRRELEQVTVEITGVADTSLGVAQVTDVKTGSVNDLLTPNRNLRMAGVKIKIEGDSPANGVYFINQATQERTRVESSDVVNNKPSEVMVVIPQLPAGEYRVEVVTQYSTGGNLLKAPRSTLFDRVLTVA